LKLISVWSNEFHSRLLDFDNKFNENNSIQSPVVFAWSGGCPGYDGRRLEGNKDTKKKAQKENK
jgi:hypothetical protein